MSALGRAARLFSSIPIGVSTSDEGVAEWLVTGEPDDDAVKDEVREVMDALSLERHMTISSAVFDLVHDSCSPLATIGMFSGGRDSTTFMHLFRDKLTHAGHANTGIGVEATRQFVRDTCAEWDLPLLEEHPPPGCTYRELVLRWGFPGPGGHGLIYSRLKERCFRQMRRRFVTNGRTERVMFVGGMRHFESERRMSNTQTTHRDGSVVWCSPIAWWPNRLLNEYRQNYDVPHNEVTDHLHMSGECLCGAYATPGELDMLRMFAPAVAVDIEQLQVDAVAAGAPVCEWGYGAALEWKRLGALGVKFMDGQETEAGPACQKCQLRLWEVPS